MSQPPLSQTIKTLERRLGTKLLARTTRAVALTSAGEVLLEQCRRLVNMADEAETATRDAASGQLGRLRIGAVTSAFFDLSPQCSPSSAASTPASTWFCASSTPKTPFVRWPSTASTSPSSADLPRHPASPAEPSSRRSSFCAVPATWDHIPGDVVDLADTAREPWISLPRHISSDYHDQVVACCRQAGFSPMVTNTADSIVSQLAMVACDIGVAIVPDSAAEYGLNLHGRRPVRAHQEADHHRTRGFVG